MLTINGDDCIRQTSLSKTVNLTFKSSVLGCSITFLLCLGSYNGNGTTHTITISSTGAVEHDGDISIITQASYDSETYTLTLTLNSNVVSTYSNAWIHLKEYKESVDMDNYYTKTEVDALISSGATSQTITHDTKPEEDISKYHIGSPVLVMYTNERMMFGCPQQLINLLIAFVESSLLAHGKNTSACAQ